MEIIGLLFLISIGLIVGYFLDLHKKIVPWIRNLFSIPDGKSMSEQFTDRYAQIVNDRKKVAVEKRTKAFADADAAARYAASKVLHRKGNSKREKIARGESLSSKPKVGSREWMQLPEVRRQIMRMGEIARTKPSPPPNPPAPTKSSGPH